MEITSIIYFILNYIFETYGLLPIVFSFTFIHLTLINAFILPFHTVHGVLKARILKWFAIPLHLNYGVGEDS